MDRRFSAAGGEARVELHWIPLGAGAHIVRLSGHLYEVLSARIHRRPPMELFHSALTITLPEAAYTVEQAPVPDLHGDRRGVVAEGPVGVRGAGRLRLFRYEVRCWRNGSIPDLGRAGATSQLVSVDPATARRILEVVPSIPTPTWGRDELSTGEMWNSNSVIAWALTRSGIDARRLAPPPRGRAPGWHAGIRVALQSSEVSSSPSPRAAPPGPGTEGQAPMSGIP